MRSDSRRVKVSPQCLGYSSTQEQTQAMLKGGCLNVHKHLSHIEVLVMLCPCESILSVKVAEGYNDVVFFAITALN